MLSGLKLDPRDLSMDNKNVPNVLLATSRTFPYLPSASLRLLDSFGFLTVNGQPQNLDIC